MEVNTIRDAFDRVAKKQKLSSSKTQEVISCVEREIEQTISKLQADSSGFSDATSLLLELKNKLNEIAPLNQLEVCHKDLNIGISKYVKSLEKCFNTDITKACRNLDFDTHLVNQIIANHFFRQGMFDIGDSFVNETNELDAATLKTAFLEMYSILEAMRSRHLEPALTWAAKQTDQLLQSGSSLQLKIHQLQYVEIVQKGSIDEALYYAKMHLAPFASAHKIDFQKLMGCLLYAGRLHQSPYAEFVSSTHWDKLAEEFTHQFCSLIGQSYESPLGIVIAAGIQGLPTLLKLASVMAAKKQEWHAMKQLPVPVDLGKEFQFHSIFVCPVLREQANHDNPPMLMPCGHVLSKQSIVKLSKSSTRAFKCPCCPWEATVAQCRQLHL